MPKKFLYAVSVLVIIAATGMANATTWSLSCKVLTVGGSLQMRSDTPITSANNTVQKSYTTSRVVPVTLIPSAGYQISAVTVNNLTQTLPVANPISMGLPAFPGRLTQIVTVSFAKQLVSVTSSSTANGTVSPSGTTSYQSGTAVSYVFTPNQGVSLLSVSGAPSGTTFKDATSGATVTLPYFGAVRVAFNVPTTPVTLTGYFIGLAANAGAPQTVLPGTLVRLAGSAVVYDGAPSVSYAWTQTGGASVVLTGAQTATPSFTPTSPGNYPFTVVATDSLGGTSSASTFVTVTNSAAAAAQAQCQGCHSSAGIGATANVYANWSSSVHESHVVLCARCHVGTDTGAHPGTLTTGKVNETSFTYLSDGTSFCLNGSCHSPGVTHKTVGMACANCHNSGEIHKPDANFSAALNVCFNCHGGANTIHYYANTGIGSTYCSACHNQQGHNPAPSAAVPRAHFNGYTSYANPNYAAAYVTPATQCENCHK
jgi:trimeric autotransporter adhesin